MPKKAWTEREKKKRETVKKYAALRAELKAKGVEFNEPVANHGYGLVTHFKMPGDFSVQLYQPLYKK